MMDTDERGPYLVLTSGAKWYLTDPDPCAVSYKDIGASLSKLCRFGGHTNPFYSVAQHSVMCAWEARKAGLNERERLTVLMHDAAEAYLLDIPTPLKGLLPDYQKLERLTEQVIADALDLIYPFPDFVKEIDARMLATEQRFLMPRTRSYASPDAPPFDDIILKPSVCWTPDNAEDAFRTEYWRLVT